MSLKGNVLERENKGQSGELLQKCNKREQPELDSGIKEKETQIQFRANGRREHRSRLLGGAIDEREK